MELEQNANFLKIKPALMGATLPILAVQIEPSSPPALGFSTLLEEEGEPSGTPEPAPAAINITQSFPIPAETMPAPEATLVVKPPIEPDNSELALAAPLILAPTRQEKPAQTPNIAAPLPKFSPAETTALPMSRPPAVAEGFVVSVAATAALPDSEFPQPALVLGESPAKPIEKTDLAFRPAPATKTDAAAASVPVANRLAAFFEPDTHKILRADSPKEPAQIPISRSPAPQPTPTFAQALMPIAQEPVLKQTETSAEPDFTITLKAERAAVQSGALLPQPARMPPLMQAQLAAQLPTQLANNTQKVIELRLDPPELGRVVIQITTQDQTVSAQILADRPDTLDLMRRHAEFFTNTLEKAGFSQSNLSFQQGGGQFQPKGQPQFQLSQADSQPEEQAALPDPARLIEGRLDIRL